MESKVTQKLLDENDQSLPEAKSLAADASTGSLAAKAPTGSPAADAPAGSPFQNGQFYKLTKKEFFKIIGNNQPPTINNGDYENVNNNDLRRVIITSPDGSYTIDQYDELLNSDNIILNKEGDKYNIIFQHNDIKYQYIFDTFKIMRNNFETHILNKQKTNKGPYLIYSNIYHTDYILKILLLQKINLENFTKNKEMSYNKISISELNKFINHDHEIKYTEGNIRITNNLNETTLNIMYNDLLNIKYKSDFTKFTIISMKINKSNQNDLDFSIEKIYIYNKKTEKYEENSLNQYIKTYYYKTIDQAGIYTILFDKNNNNININGDPERRNAIETSPSYKIDNISLDINSGLSKETIKKLGNLKSIFLSVKNNPDSYQQIIKSLEKETDSVFKSEMKRYKLVIYNVNYAKTFSNHYDVIQVINFDEIWKNGIITVAQKGLDEVIKKMKSNNGKYSLYFIKESNMRLLWGHDINKCFHDGNFPTLDIEGPNGINIFNYIDFIFDFNTIERAEDNLSATLHKLTNPINYKYDYKQSNVKINMNPFVNTHTINLLSGGGIKPTDSGIGKNYSGLNVNFTGLDTNSITTLEKDTIQLFTNNNDNTNPTFLNKLCESIDNGIYYILSIDKKLMSPSCDYYKDFVWIFNKNINKIKQFKYNDAFEIGRFLARLSIYKDQCTEIKNKYEFLIKSKKYVTDLVKQINKQIETFIQLIKHVEENIIMNDYKTDIADIEKKKDLFSTNIKSLIDNVEKTIKDKE